MKFSIILTVLIFNLSIASASEFLIYLESAYKNNPILNAERENYKAIKENINISRSEFLPIKKFFKDLTVIIQLKNLNLNQSKLRLD